MSDLHTLLGDALGPIYRIEREVRPVGACRMFIAAEIPTGPELSVKVFPGALSLAVDVSKFERELLLLADKLRATGLVVPKGTGRAGAFIYHTRPFLEGTTLRATLAKSGELPLRQVVAILSDVLAGLAAAHETGVAHGDLKPENVLLGEKRAYVADTGVVAAVDRSLVGGATDAATPVLCDPHYLAPERRDREGAAGPASDMYAVGVLAHEMLTGRTPAPESESLEDVRSLPAWLAELVRGCLAPDAKRRWPNAGAARATMSSSR